MELAFITYLISILDSLQGFFMFIVIIAAVVTFFLCIIGTSERKHYHLLNKLWYSGTVMLFSGLLIALIPDKKDAYIVLGAYVTQEIATSPHTIEIGQKLLNVINKNLDEMLIVKEPK